MYKTNILEYLEHTALIYPNRLAISDGAVSLSFAELLSLSRSVGSFLLKQGYFGQPILIMMDKSPYTVSALLGVVYAGCFYAVADTDDRSLRMRAVCDTLKPAAIICDGSNRAQADALTGVKSVFLFDDAALQEHDEYALDTVRIRSVDVDPIYVVFTSGSTGEPKGVVGCHRSVIDYTETLCEALGFSCDTVFANQAPLSFDAPLKEIMPSLKLGASVYLVPRHLFSFPAMLFDFLDKYRINTVCWVSSAFTLAASVGALERRKPRYLDKICFGSEILPRKIYDVWRTAFPCATFINLYGPTEATGMSCFWIADRALEENEPIPIGRPFRNTEIILLDGDGQRASAGEVGEMYIRGSSLTLGYFGDREGSEKSFLQFPCNRSYRDIVYRTGDLAYENRHGELVFVSRCDGIVKHMGHKINLCEIETIAQGLHASVRACCVYVKEMQRIILFYTGDVSESELFAYIREHVPRYMLPKVTIRLDGLPVTRSGKLDRRGAAELARNLNRNNGGDVIV